ncbi:MAG: alpha/beta hydrolase [Rubrivivax sp.]|nr:alpha/beta hydrolase [Rubrivivax sp.]
MTTNEGSAPEWFRWALQHPGRSHRVSAGGIELHYLGWGLEASGKPAVLLVHGHRAHAHWWDHVAPFLTNTHRVYAMDLSGMGDSDRRVMYPRDVGGQDIVDLVRALGLGPLTVIGHSNGGLRTFGACALAPELFQRVIAIDSYAVFKGGKHPTEPQGLRGDRIYASLAEATGRYRLLPDQPLIEPWVRAHIARHSLREVPGGWTWKFDPLMPSGLDQEADGDKLLVAVRCPVHYIYGAESAIVNEALAQRIVQSLPQGHGPIAIPGGHHHLMFDQPVALIATLRALLA